MAKVEKSPEEYGYRFVKCEPPIRTGKESNALAQRWLETQDPALKERLVIGNRRFVGALSARFTCFPPIMRRDLIGEGYVGLVKAINNYDEGGSFSSYAFKHIFGGMMGYLAANRRLINIPYQFIKEARETGKSAEEIEDLVLKQAKKTDEAQYFLIDEVKHTLRAPQDSEGERREQLDFLREAFSVLSLNKNERFVIQTRYLQNRHEVPTFRQLGKAMRLTGGRVQQIHARALRKIRWYMEKKRYCEAS